MSAQLTREEILEWQILQARKVSNERLQTMAISEATSLQREMDDWITHVSDAHGVAEPFTWDKRGVLTSEAPEPAAEPPPVPETQTTEPEG